MDLNYSGIAAADALDALNTAADFEPTATIDTVALDATYDAIEAAYALIARLGALQDHLAAGGDADTAADLAVRVHLSLGTVGDLIGAEIAA